MKKEMEKPVAKGATKIFNDPGNILIVVYFMIIIFLILLGNLATASTKGPLNVSESQEHKSQTSLAHILTVR